MLTDFVRPEHRIIMEALHLMDFSLLLANQCWFAGGTAIVMKLGEYRQSLDVDFLCSDNDGYRDLRLMAVRSGIRAFFPEPVESLREPRIDQYGIRAALRYRDQVIKFEIVREARIMLSGETDAELGVPTLTYADMFAEKLLANADRCQDRSVGYRDAIDLGMLLERYGEIPQPSLTKAIGAYGPDIQQKVEWVVRRLTDIHEIRQAAERLEMDFRVASGAVERLVAESRRLWGTDGKAKD